MGADVRAPWLLARAWRPGAPLGAVPVALVAALLVPRAAVAIPAAGGASSLLWPLLPTVVAVTMPSFLAAADGALERTAAVPAWLLRLVGLGVVVAVMAAATAPAALRFDGCVVARNAAMMTGLAAAGVAVLPAGASWMPVACTPIVMWLLGTDPTTRRLHAWAVLLAPRDSSPALLVAVLVLGVGTLAYTGKPWLTSGWWPTARRPRRG